MMAVAGYEKAKLLMKQKDWKLRVVMDGEDLQQVQLYHPGAPDVYAVRKDSFKRLYPECRIVGRGEDDRTAILCYDHAGSDESLI